MGVLLLVVLILAVLLNYGAFGARWRGLDGLIYGDVRELRHSS